MNDEYLGMEILGGLLKLSAVLTILVSVLVAFMAGLPGGFFPLAVGVGVGLVLLVAAELLMAIRDGVGYLKDLVELEAEARRKK